jgi:tetratricopeptide (TPR) repeat protein
VHRSDFKLDWYSHDKKKVRGMTKEDIVNEVSEGSGQPKTRIATALDLFLSEVTEAMVRQERVEIRRFGTFEVTNRKSRVARNFNSDKEIKLPARAQPRFVPFKAFKERVEKALPLVASPAKSPSNPAVKQQNPRQQEKRPLPQPPVNEIDAIRARVQLDGEDVKGRLALAQACLAAGSYQEAAEQARAILQRDSSNMSALNIQGEVYEMQDSTDRAMQEFEKAARIDKDDVPTLMNIGRLKGKIGQHNNAELNYKRVLELEPENVQACFRLGVLHTKRGLYGRAIQDFEKVTRLDPDNIEAYFHLGKTYDHLERYDDAIQMFEQLLKVQPDNDRAYWHLGMLHDKKKDGAKALEMYQHSNRLSSASKKDRR